MPRKISTDAAICPGRDVEAGRREAEPAGQHRRGRTSRARPKAITWNTELSATRTAAASRSPQARSFQMMTMAMQRARPTMIRPVRYSGRSGRSSQASANISAGPTSQFRTSEDDQQPAVAGDGVEAVVADLGQHRVHHHQQPERDRQGDAVDRDRVQRRRRGRGSAARPAARRPSRRGSTPAGTGRAWRASRRRRPRSVRSRRSLAAPAWSRARPLGERVLCRPGTSTAETVRASPGAPGSRPRYRAARRRSARPRAAP